MWWHTPQPDAVPTHMAFGLLGCVGLAFAEISALLAREHALLRGAICGAVQVPHCGWCYAAAASAIGGAAALATATSPTRLAPARAVPRRIR